MEHEPLPVVGDVDQAADEALLRLHDDTLSVALCWEYRRGEPEQALAQADRVFENVFECPS